jgi:heterodisulfide reductase subunit C
MNDTEMKALEKEITESVQRCWKCRMCVAMCPTYEGWFTQSTAGRLMAINLYIKHGLGNLEELSDILYSCTTCRRCQERCKALSTDCRPADTILKARQYLVKLAESKGEEQHE